MKHPKTYCLFAFLFLFCFSKVNAQALHWLSQPDVDVGPVSNNTTSEVKVSANGRYIAFISSSTNLVEEDNNHFSDVFIRDLQTGETQLVSVTTGGLQPTDGFFRTVSAPTSDGRYVAFVTSSSVFPGATGTQFDDFLYVKDMQTGAIVNHSDYNGGSYFEPLGEIKLSDDGQFVTFASYYEIDPLHNGFDTQIYRKNLSSDTFELLSVSQDGLSQGDDDSEFADVSDNGRYVLMSSKANNLTADIINNSGENLFIRDTQLNTTTLVNITPGGVNSSDSNGFIQEAAISNLGQVAFKSTQSDLVNNDNNARNDIFFFNGGTIQRINLTDSGDEIVEAQGHSSHVTISGDGSRIAFSEYSDELFPAYTNEAYDLYVYDTSSETLSLISKTSSGAKANGNSWHPDLTTDGNRIVFLSRAGDLTNDPVMGEHDDVFHYNFTSDVMKLETPAQINPNTVLSGVYYPRVSSDQLSVIYSSRSPNLVAEPLNDYSLDLFLLDRTTNTHSKIASEIENGPGISPSGNYISFSTQYFPPDGMIDLGAPNVFLYNRINDTYTQIEQGKDSRVNDNGVVVFSTYSDIDPNDTNSTIDLYFFNPSTQSVELISKDMSGHASSIYHFQGFDIGGSNNNTWVTFTSANANIVPNDTNAAYDIFMKKLPNGTISRVTETVAGMEANGYSTVNSISADGNWVVFKTGANNLTTDDYSQAYAEQIILFDRINHQYTLASKNDDGLPISAQGTEYLEGPSVSDTGRYISYRFDDAFGAVDQDFNGDIDNEGDIILFDSVSQTPKLISKHTNGLHSDDEAYYFSEVVEDTTLSPTLVGLVFAADGGDLTGISNHPGHQEVFLYQQGGPELTLNLLVQGPGTVIGTSGINCSGSCQYTFPLGADLTLSAFADSNMQFVGWQVDFGNCDDDSNPCNLIMDREKTLTAVFFDDSELIFKNGFE